VSRVTGRLIFFFYKIYIKLYCVYYLSAWDTHTPGGEKSFGDLRDVERKTIERQNIDYKITLISRTFNILSVQNLSIKIHLPNVEKS